MRWSNPEKTTAGSGRSRSEIGGVRRILPHTYMSDEAIEAAAQTVQQSPHSKRARDWRNIKNEEN